MKTAWALIIAAAAHEVEELTEKCLTRALEEYVAEEHGDKHVFVHTSVYLELDKHVKKMLEKSGRQTVPHTDVESIEWKLVEQAALHREKASVTEIDDHEETLKFTRDSIECSDIKMHPLAYTGVKKCSPKLDCWRKHLPEFEGAAYEEAFKAKLPVVLTRQAGEAIGITYNALADLIDRMVDATLKEIGTKGRGLHLVHATLEDSDQPAYVEGVKAVGVEYSVVFLFDGRLRFRSRTDTREAKSGLVMFTSGIENIVDASGKRLHVRMSCDSTFSNPLLAERLPKIPGKGRLVRSHVADVDWRQWFFYVFVLIWMFRF